MDTYPNTKAERAPKFVEVPCNSHLHELDLSIKSQPPCGRTFDPEGLPDQLEKVNRGLEPSTDSGYIGVVLG